MHVTTNIFSFTVLCVFVSTTEMIDANVGKVVSSVGSYLRKHILMYFLLLHINISAYYCSGWILQRNDYIHYDIKYLFFIPGSYLVFWEKSVMASKRIIL